MAKLAAWMAGSLTRQFPRSEPGAQRRLELDVARGERVSFQVCARNLTAEVLEVSVEQCGGELGARLRRVGTVPVPHHNTDIPPEDLDGRGHLPGYVPDPLFDETSARVAPGETQAFWVTVKVPREIEPGRQEILLELVSGEERPRLRAVLQVAEPVLEPRRDFAVMHWFYADALLDWYGLEPFESRFWRVLEPYLRDLAEHGNDTSHLPLFTPPTDGVKRPTQLLHITRAGDRYRFDWREVRRWVKLAQRCGLEYFEWPHLFTQWGARHAVRMYEGQGEGEKLLWPARTGATSARYRGFLGQFLPEFHSFLKREKLLERSFFHVSDEPHGEQARRAYVRARGVLRELAPWMRTLDALSEIEYGRKGLTDFPVPLTQVTRQYYEEGIPSFTYFCCAPRGRFVQRLLDTPLANTRMAGWLFYRFQRLGFLHWGYNYWYRSQTRQLLDPYTVTDGTYWPGWAYGDTFQVYPGPQGPVDSLRWEVFADSLQDYALLQTAGVDPEGKLLSELRDFDDFPRTESWLRQARRKILQGRAR